MKKKVIILTLVSLLFTTGCGNGLPKNTTIITEESLNTNYETFSNDDFTMKIPSGYKLEIALDDSDHYTFKLYNPKDERYLLFFNMKSEGFLKSNKARKAYAQSHPDSTYAKLPSIDEKTTSYYFSVWDEIIKSNDTSAFKLPYIGKLKNIIEIGQTSDNGNIITATFKNNQGQNISGIFTTTIVDPGPYYIASDKNNPESAKIDVGPLSVYDTVVILAPEDKLINYQEIFLKSLSTLRFSEKFKNSLTDINLSIYKEKTTYDLLAGKISQYWNLRDEKKAAELERKLDTKMGYERVYNTKTDEIYKAEIGFTNNNSKNIYKLCTDEMYLKPINGYIIFEK